MSRPDGESAKEETVGTPAHSVKTTRIDPRNFTEQHHPPRRESGNRYYTPEMVIKGDYLLILPPFNNTTNPRPPPRNSWRKSGRKIPWK
jgi:hypothetical protein